MAREELRGLPGLREWPSGRWARHRPWVIPALGAIVSFLGLVALNDHGSTLPKHSQALVWTALAFLVVALFFVACIVVTSIKARAVRRAYQRSRGRYNKSEMAAAARVKEADKCWIGAVALAHSLAAGHVPDIEKVWGVVLRDGERIMADAPAEYSRYYRTDDTYTHVSGFYYGPMGFMALGYGLTALGNASRRRAARAAAQTQWREFQGVRVLVTSDRLLCLMADGRWLSFYYSRATAVYPEAENWSLVMDFPDTVPIRLGGFGSPLAAVAAVWAVHGRQGVKTHPGLARLWEQPGL